MTRIHNVHEREIAAPAALVGESLDTVGSADDRLWATDIWVAEPVVFDRPLGVGASGGHGSIRYSVLEYEPSRRIVFEFVPGGGLSGTHRFELEPLGPDRCRLRHVLEAETSRWMRPLEPILIGWHDAMVETALDRAELGATGSLDRRTRIPRWLRIVNGAEIAIARALGRIPPAAGRDGGRLPLGYRMFGPAGTVVARPTRSSTSRSTHRCASLSKIVRPGRPTPLPSPSPVRAQAGPASKHGTPAPPARCPNPHQPSRPAGCSGCVAGRCPGRSGASVPEGVRRPDRRRRRGRARSARLPACS
jgi:hypothetical protein